MAQECLDNVLGQLSYDNLASHPHSSFPRHALHRDELALDGNNVAVSFKNLFRQLCHDLYYPNPIFPPTVVTVPELNGVDSSLEIVKLKKKWATQKEFLLNSCKSVPEGIRQELSSGTVLTQNEATIPKNITLLAQHLDNDPDMMFNGTYNWYFTGGNLETTTLDGNMYLVNVSSMSEKCLYVTKCSYENGTWTPSIDDRFSIVLPSPDSVFQLETHKSNLLIRQLTTLSHLMLSPDENGLSLNRCYSAVSLCPYVSSSINSTEPKEFCSLLCNRTLEIHDALQERIMLQGVVPDFCGNQSIVDNWGNVRYIDDKSILYMDRTDVGVIDLRVGLQSFVQKWSRMIEPCNYFSCSSLGRGDLLYVGSRHHLYSLDRRRGFSVCWTHSMPHYPTVIKSILSNDGLETIFLGSQRCDSIYLIMTEMVDDSIFSATPTKSIPCPRTSLQVARANGYLLDTFITSRFTFCLTGLCCIENNERITVFRSTSLGDVFKQTVIPNHRSYDRRIPFTQDEFVPIRKWQKQCESLLLKCDHSTPETANYRDSFICSKILKYLNQGSHSSSSSSSECNRVRKDPWRVSTKTVDKYCDYLAPNLVNAWKKGQPLGDLCCKSIEADALSSSDEEEDLNKKVNEWLASSIHVPPDFDVENPDNDLMSRPSTSGLKKEFRDDDKDMIESDSDECSSLLSSKKKKKSFTPGF